MTWGKAFSDAWDSATDTARAAASNTERSMAAAADSAVDTAKAAKTAATGFVNRGVATAPAAGDKVADTYNAIKQNFSLRDASKASVQDFSAPGRKLGELDCPGLAGEKDKLAQAQTRAKLADAVYKDPDQQKLREGWSRASDDDLKKLGLIDSNGGRLTEIPDSDFKVDVFKGPDGKYVVAFKGATPSSMEDWKNNIQQGAGNPGDYYSRALRIADQLHANDPDNVEYAGHSLGGGLASAAAASYGSPATTFNAAGLNDKTLLRTGVASDSANSNAYYVQGDILSGPRDNSFGLAPQAAGKRMELSPADSVTMDDVKAGAIVGAVSNSALGVVAGMGARGVRLHGMDSVEDALAKRMNQIDLLRQHKGCV